MNQCTNSPPNFQVCRPATQVRLSATCQCPSFTGFSKLCDTRVNPLMEKLGTPFTPLRFGRPCIPIASINSCPLTSASDFDTRMGAPARNSLYTFEEMEYTSPTVKKWTLRIFVDVPTLLGGSCDRAPGIS